MDRFKMSLAILIFSMYSVYLSTLRMREHRNASAKSFYTSMPPASLLFVGARNSNGFKKKKKSS